jgi:hypothetical protein
VRPVLALPSEAGRCGAAGVEAGVEAEVVFTSLLLAHLLAKVGWSAEDCKAFDWWRNPFFPSCLDQQNKTELSFTITSIAYVVVAKNGCLSDEDSARSRIKLRHSDVALPAAPLSEHARPLDRIIKTPRRGESGCTLLTTNPTNVLRQLEQKPDDTEQVQHTPDPPQKQQTSPCFLKSIRENPPQSTKTPKSSQVSAKDRESLSRSPREAA